MNKTLLTLIATSLCSISIASTKESSGANVNLPMNEYHVFTHQDLSFKAAHDIYLHNTTDRQVLYNWKYELCIFNEKNRTPVQPCYSKIGSLRLVPDQVYRESHNSHIETNFVIFGGYHLIGKTTITGEFPGFMQKDARIIVQ